MEKSTKNQFILQGEIAEIFSSNSTVKAKIMCKPGTLLFEIPSVNHYQLGDKVVITGSFTCEKIENLNLFKTNN